jgi:hypothetical protein
LHAERLFGRIGGLGVDAVRGDQENTIRSGGLVYEAGWLNCRALASYRSGEALVNVRSVEPEDQLGFFVDQTLVRPEDLSRNEEKDGTVKVILVERNGGTSKVSVPGEPLSFGPTIIVRNDDLH